MRIFILTSGQLGDAYSFGLRLTYIRAILWFKHYTSDTDVVCNKDEIKRALDKISFTISRNIKCILNPECTISTIRETYRNVENVFDTLIQFMSEYIRDTQYRIKFYKDMEVTFKSIYCFHYILEEVTKHQEVGIVVRNKESDYIFPINKLRNYMYVLVMSCQVLYLEQTYNNVYGKLQLHQENRFPINCLNDDQLLAAIINYDSTDEQADIFDKIKRWTNYVILMISLERNNVVQDRENALRNLYSTIIHNSYNICNNLCFAQVYHRKCCNAGY